MTCKMIYAFLHCFIPHSLLSLNVIPGRGRASLRAINVQQPSTADHAPPFHDQNNLVTDCVVVYRYKERRGYDRLRDGSESCISPLRLTYVTFFWNCSLEIIRSGLSNPLLEGKSIVRYDTLFVAHPFHYCYGRNEEVTCAFYTSPSVRA